VPALVPAPLWGKSVHNALTRKNWRSLRQTVLEAAANTCRYCEAQYDSGMICHEVWAYNDEDYTATLIEFVMVCRDCNAVLHVGKSLLIGDRKGSAGMLDRGEQAVQHLRNVNAITDQEARELIKDAFKTYSERSRRAWDIHIAAHIIEKHPLLAGLEL